jgi:hypothetical protein
MFPTRLLKAKLTKRFNATSEQCSTFGKVTASLVAGACAGFAYGLYEGCNDCIEIYKNNNRNINYGDLTFEAVNYGFYYAGIGFIFPVSLPVIAYTHYRVNRE